MARRNEGPTDDDVVGRQVSHLFDRTARGTVVASDLTKTGVVMVDFAGGPRNHPCILDELVPLDPRDEQETDEADLFRE